MQRYAKLVDGQLVFNETEDWIDMLCDKWVPYGSDEGGTVRAFEKKYGIRLYWRERIVKQSDGTNLVYLGYFDTKED